jgi:hypothetical protein
MAEACYTARATTKQQVLNGVKKLTLQTNEHGQYTHDAILLLQKGIRHVLISQFNPSDLGKGMENLLNDGNNLLTLVKSTDVITANSVINAAKKELTSSQHQPEKPSSPPSHHKRRHRRKPTNLISSINWSSVPKKVWSKPSPSWLAVMSPMPSSVWPTAATTKVSTTSLYLK